MNSFGKMLKALPHHSRDRSRSRERGKSPIPEPVSPGKTFGETTATRPKWNLAPQKTDPVITIKPASTNSQAEGIWSLSISCSKINYNETIETPNPFDTDLQKDIRWFIEDFSRNDPLNRDKALDTRNAVRYAGEFFVKALKLDEIVEKLTTDVRTMTSTIIIQVEDDLSRPNNLYALPWELLEHPSFWPDGTKYDKENAKCLGLELVVKRHAIATKRIVERRVQRNTGVYSFEVSFSIGSIKDQYPTYNILIVANRHASDQDDEDSHGQIAQMLHAALSSVDEAIHVHVDICRPGSWEAFQKFVGQRKKGFWNVVHLDMPVARGAFHFLGATSADFDPVPDYEVAEFLHKHEVSTVFLTCNEAGPNSDTTTTELAIPFVAEGIPVVVSSPYRLPKIYLMLTSSGFYQSILALHRRGPSFAAHVARKALQTQEINHLGRYHIPVKNTVEGLGLIVYDNGATDKLDITQFCYPNTDKTPKRFGNTAYQDAWLFGRDLDMMRLENRLLSRPESSNILWMTGKKSVGKSMLLGHLTYWWALSKFIATSVYIDLGQCLDDFAGVLVQFATVIPTVGLGETYSEKHLAEIKNATDVKKTKVYKDMVKLFRTYRLFLYFDNVEFWRPTSLNKTMENERRWNEQKKVFLEFVEEIRGGLSFILLVCPYNNRSIRGTNPVYELKSLGNRDISNMYGIVEWDKWVEGSSSISTKQTMAQQELAREIVQFHDGIVEVSQGLMGAKQQFVYNLPFDTERRTRDIYILLHSNQPGTAGPYNMDTSPSAILVEHLYDLVIRDRDDLEDKSPDANANILRLMFSLSTFFGRVPKDISYYLILLHYYGLFESTWALPGRRHEYNEATHDQILDVNDFPEAAAAFEDSTINKEWKRLVQILIDYDFASHDGDDYYILNPMVTFCMRKIVYASDGPLTTPILPLAIRLAATDFHMHRYKTINYGTPLDATCKTLLEKHTFISQILSASAAESTPLKALHLLASSPFRVFFTNWINAGNVLADSDKRAVLHLAGCIANEFDSFISPSSPFAATPKVYDSPFFYEFWRMAYTSAERVAIYHNGTSHLADAFDTGVMMMRRCKAFGLRYEASRRREDGMDSFDESLQAAEGVREDLIGMGILQDNGAENGVEPPPAYEPAAEQEGTSEER